MKGLSLVFAFTFKHIAGEKKYRNWTLVLALIFFLAPLILLPLAERNRQEAAEIPLQIEEADLSKVEAVYYAVRTDDGFAWNAPEQISGIRFIRAESPEAARKEAESGGEGAYSLLIRGANGSYEVIGLTEDDADDAALLTASALAEILAEQLPAMLTAEMDLSGDKAAALDAAASISVFRPDDAESEEAAFRELAGILLPYVSTLLIYFLVILCGNTVAGNVILEKTSKLMDTFLISVKPKAMIMGKVLAAWCASLLQLLLWLASLAGGFGLGAKLARSIHPNSTMGVLRFLDFLTQTLKFFSPLHLLIALLLIAAGFLLYCSFAGIAGSFASKPEELSSTIQLFQLVLVFSFLAVTFLCSRGNGMPAGPMWYDFVPFTAILITPARLLMDLIPLWTGLASLGLTALLALLSTFFAGKVYSIMSLYKGTVPKKKDMLKVMFS